MAAALLRVADNRRRIAWGCLVLGVTLLLTLLAALPGMDLGGHPAGSAEARDANTALFFWLLIFGLGQASPRSIRVRLWITSAACAIGLMLARVLASRLSTGVNRSPNRVRQSASASPPPSDWASQAMPIWPRGAFRCR
ncbi:hypothetical protein [Lactiplantibacillus plantarum]|uniref:hypothetical protein n=1 Tax=Lactiplantibacillus plantarum TaxID=1590 RepID=UPI004046064E